MNSILSLSLISLHPCLTYPPARGSQSIRIPLIAFFLLHHEYQKQTLVIERIFDSNQ